MNDDERARLQATETFTSSYFADLPEAEPVQATCVSALDLAEGAWIARPKSDATPGVGFDESLERAGRTEEALVGVDR